MLDVEHRPVYGSKETDEFICSCGWRGPTFAVAAHQESVARQARADIEAFAALVEDECSTGDWECLDGLEGRPGYLSPLQFAIALRNQGFKRKDA
jgi:hypothetical protein